MGLPGRRQASSPLGNIRLSDRPSPRRSSTSSSSSGSSNSSSQNSSSGSTSQEPATTITATAVEDALPPAVAVVVRKLLHEREMLSIHYRQAVQEREKLAKDTKTLQRRYAEVRAQRRACARGVLMALLLESSERVFAPALP